VTCIKENKLNFFIKKNKIKKIVVITGKKSFNFSGFKNLKIFKDFKYITTVLYKKKSIPEINELKSFIKKINIINPDLIIALGGGCVIDYAKLLNGLHNIKNLKNKIKKNKIKINSNKTKILAIPTTAGSGAEVTPFSVIYVDNIKYSIEHTLLKPDFFSLIPKLVINSSKTVRASAGFDAIAQACESIFSKKANIDSLKNSSRSLRCSIKNFLGFVNSPNLTNAESMLTAANLAGEAISTARTNAPHSLSYFFTSHFKIPHGIAVSVFFIEFIKFYYYSINNYKNLLSLRKKINFFFKAIKIKNINEFELIFKIILIKSGIKKILDNYNIDYKKNFKLIIKSINKERLSNAPVSVKNDDLKKIILQSF
jgi:alcohol dehydrogenase class IV